MIASRAFLRPTVLASVALLVLNDHVLKARFPGVVTGKLSDLAGLVFFPLLLAAIAEQIGVRRGMATVKTAVIATGVAFAAFKLSASAGDVYRIGLAAVQWPVRAVLALADGTSLPSIGRAHLTRDPTDLVALVSLAIPLWLARSEQRGREREQRAATPATCSVL